MTHSRLAFRRYIYVYLVDFHTFWNVSIFFLFFFLFFFRHALEAHTFIPRLRASPMNLSPLPPICVARLSFIVNANFLSKYLSIVSLIYRRVFFSSSSFFFFAINESNDTLSEMEKKRQKGEHRWKEKLKLHVSPKRNFKKFT